MSDALCRCFKESTSWGSTATTPPVTRPTAAVPAASFAAAGAAATLATAPTEVVSPSNRTKASRITPKGAMMTGASTGRSRFRSSRLARKRSDSTAGWVTSRVSASSS